MHNVCDDIGRAVMQALGGELIALYVVGSFAHGNGIAASDLDMIAVFPAEPSPEQLQRLWQVRDALREKHGVDLDLQPRAWPRLKHGGLGVKREGRLVCGRDIRGEIEELTPDEIRRQAPQTALRFIQQLRPGEALTAATLAYPNAADEFKGYVDYAHRMRPLAPLLSPSFIATARIAQAAGILITNKHELPAAYQAHVGDRFAPFVRDLLALCRDRWGYQIPENAAERHRLVQLCETALEFERDFLRILESELRQP